MPKERINSSSNNDWGDLMVAWSSLGSAEQSVAIHGAEGLHVDIWPVAREIPGGGGYFSFTPDMPETFNGNPGESYSPVSMSLNREQINRLIRVLRRARDGAYGTDE